MSLLSADRQVIFEGNLGSLSHRVFLAWAVSKDHDANKDQKEQNGEGRIQIVCVRLHCRPKPGDCR